MGLFSLVFGPKSKVDPALARNLQQRGIVDVQGNPVVDPNAVRASNTIEVKKRNLQGRRAIERQVGYEVNKNLEDINQITQTAKKIGDIKIPVPSKELALRTTLTTLMPSPFRTIADIALPPIKNLTSSITVKDVAQESARMNAIVPKIAARTALEFAKPGTEVVPNTPESKFILGNEPLKPITQPTEDSFLGLNIGSKTASLVQKGLQRIGFTPDTSRKIAGSGIGVFAGIINNPFLGTEKKAAEETIGEIANLTKSEEILPKLKSLFVGADENALRPLSEKLSSISKIDDVKNEITNFIKNIGEGTPNTPEDKFVADYVKELTTQQAKARVAEEPTIGQKIIKTANELKRDLVDSFSPIEDKVKAAQKAGNFEILPKSDISTMIDNSLRSGNLAGQFAKDKGLASIITDTAPNADEFSQYLIARQARDVAARGITTGRDLTKDEKLIQLLAPKYEQQAQRIGQYSRDLLDYATESGLISPELNTTLKERYPNYVPINRIFNDIEQANNISGNGAGQVASLSSQSVIKKLEGSERAIEDPILSLMEKTRVAFNQGERNKAAAILASYKQLPGFENLIKELPAGETAPHTFSYLENGVKKVFSTTEDIARAAKRLNPNQIGLVGRIMAYPVRLAKAGITGLSLPFIGANLAKDQFTAFINSDKALQTSLLNPKVFTKALFSAVNHDDLYEEMVRMGGGGTSFDMLRDKIPETVESLRSKSSIGSRVKYLVTNPSQLLKSFEDIVSKGEEFTRIKQYEGTKQALLKEGRTLEDAKIIAAKAARRDTVDFYRSGEMGQVLNSVLLYLNAGIQGGRTLIRSLKERPIQTTAKIAVSALMPTALLTTWNLSDDKRREAYNDIPAFEKENNMIFIPSNPTKDEKGRWNVIKIPYSSEVSKLSLPVRRALEQAWGLDKVRFGEVANALLSTPLPFNIVKSDSQGDKLDINSIASTVTPQLIKPTLEGYTNKNFFTGLPQVPGYINGVDSSLLSPENQVKPNTSGSARIIGQFLDISPIKVEDFVRGTAGSVGSQLLNATDRVLAGVGIIPKNQIGGQNIADAIASRFTKTQGGAADQASSNEIRKVIRDQADDKFITNQEAEMVFTELKSMTKQEAKQKLIEIAKKDEKVANKILDLFEQESQGLNRNDRLIKQLNVENGNRAKYISAALDSLNTADEKKSFLKDLYIKKVMSDEVFNQVVYLQKQKKNQKQ